VCEVVGEMSPSEVCATGTGIGSARVLILWPELVTLGERCSRWPWWLWPLIIDGTIIPANYPLTAQERDKRLNLFYRPYHDAVGAMISSVAQASGAPPLIISVHSFTPTMQGRSRPIRRGCLEWPCWSWE
jgi:hypothetical protein